MALMKRRALEYLEAQSGPVTVKQLSIDLDCRQSSGNELLERMAGQGLVHRHSSQRPREYVLTDAGRKRLEFFRRAENSEAAGDGATSPSSQRPEADGFSTKLDELREQIESGFASLKVDALRDEIRVGFSSVREDVGDLVQGFLSRDGLIPPAAASVRSLSEELDELLETREPESDEDSDESPDPRVVGFFKARIERAKVGFFGRTRELDKQIDELERELGEETAQAVARVLELEAKKESAEALSERQKRRLQEQGTELGLSEEEAQELSGLRAKLNLPESSPANDEEVAVEETA